MLTASDKKYISSEVASQIEKALRKNNEILVKEMIELFDVTNERIDDINVRLSKRIDDMDEKLGDKIDKVLDQLKTDDNSIDEHERRISKLENKAFAT